MKEMIIEHQSKFDFDKTVAILEAEIITAGWRQMALHNLQQSLHNNGYEVLPIKVIELCNPHHAQKIISLDDKRMYSNFMPCRISVYEKSDGNVYVSLLNAGVMAQEIGGVVENVMSTVFDESLKLIEAVINKNN